MEESGGLRICGYGRSERKDRDWRKKLKIHTFSSVFMSFAGLDPDRVGSGVCKDIVSGKWSKAMSNWCVP